MVLTFCYSSEMAYSSPIPITDRFWSRVNKNGPIPEHRPELGRCWLWTKHTNPKGYGTFTGFEVSILVHRIAFTLAGNVISEDHQLDHLCLNTSCCNPEHLEPVTNAENMRRRKDVAMHCPNGHAYSPENEYHRPDRPGTRECIKCNRIASRQYRQRCKERNRANVRA